jgi:hypothetical protein
MDAITRATGLPFETWVKLYKENPVHFERMRQLRLEVENLFVENSKRRVWFLYVIRNREPFETWVRLFRNSEDFDELRKLRLEVEILFQKDPEIRARLLRILWRLEQEMERFGNGLARYNAVVGRFWERDFPEWSRCGNYRLLMETAGTPQPSATIVQFKRS